MRILPYLFAYTLAHSTVLLAMNLNYESPIVLIADSYFYLLNKRNSTIPCGDCQQMTLDEKRDQTYFCDQCQKEFRVVESYLDNSWAKVGNDVTLREAQGTLRKKSGHRDLAAIKRDLCNFLSPKNMRALGVSEADPNAYSDNAIIHRQTVADILGFNDTIVDIYFDQDKNDAVIFFDFFIKNQYQGTLDIRLGFSLHSKSIDFFVSLDSASRSGSAPR